MKCNVPSEATAQGCSVTLHPECMRAAAGQGRSEDRRESRACSRLADTSNILPSPLTPCAADNLFKIHKRSAAVCVMITFINTAI